MASDSVNVEQILSALGVPENTAKQLQSRMNGMDYLNLVNSLDDDSPAGKKTAQQILSKYGIKLNKVPQMDNTRLESIFQGVHAGKNFDEASQMQFVRPISEMESLGAKMSGYSNFVRAANDTDAETLRDWLEENEFDYQNNDKHTFLVQSADREKAYRLNHFMGKMTGKTSVMDSDEVVEEKKKMAKDDLPKQRNPYAQHLAKKGNAVHADKTKKTDKWDRSAKHKGQQYESVTESVFSHGETVQFEGADCQVQIPTGPNGTVGLLIDGKVRMVRESEVSRIDEGVLGMTKVDPLYRLKELAGVKSVAKPELAEDDFSATVDPNMDMDVADDFDDAELDPMGADLGSDLADDSLGGIDNAPLGADDLDTGLETGELSADPHSLGGSDLGGLGSDPVDMDSDFAAGEPGDMGGVPGDIPGLGVGANVPGMMPTDSQAYTEIQDHLNNIQNSLGDVKLSEYRSLLAKLDALSSQIRSMGRDYLGEARRLKK